VFVGLFVAVFASIDSTFDKDWEAWKDFHDKEYRNEDEEHHRRITWEHNVKSVMHHNIKHSLGESTFTMGVNQFTDMTRDEFARITTGFKPSVEQKHKRRHTKAKHHSCRPKMLDEVNVPDSVDWRTEGYVTEVKDELGCISSQYFGVTGTLEGQWFRKTGQLTSLSEQNLKDCCEKDPTKCSTFLNGTCSLDATYQYIKIKGIESLADYPDKSTPESCMYDPNKRVASLSGYDYIDPTEKQLRVAVASIGPIATAVDASQASFMSYASGVYDEPKCSSTNLDHAMLIVGYGTDTTAGDYWIVKNSWGPKWGMNGYMLMSRNKNNQCGIATTTSYPYFSC